MADKIRSKVWIAGREYFLNGDESEAYIQRIGRSVDRRMADIQLQYPQLSSSVVAVLAAVNITEELFGIQNEIEQLRLQIAQEQTLNAQLRAIAEEREMRIKELEQEILVLKAQKHDIQQQKKELPVINNLRRNTK